MSQPSEQTADQTSDQTTDQTSPVEPKKVANERPKYGPQHRRRGGMMGGRVPTEKALNFWPSLKRLATYLKPERLKLVFVFIAGAISVALSVYAPKLLGRATDTIMTGFIGSVTGRFTTPEATQLFQAVGCTTEPVTTKQQVLDVVTCIHGLPASALAQLPQQAFDALDLIRNQFTPDMLKMAGGYDFTPNVGVDFHHLALIVFLAIGFYLVSALGMAAMGWLLNGIVQRTVFAMRQQVAAKLDALPLSYFDHQPPGELLSRVTNDIDNISTALQQSLQQVVNSLLTVIGVLIMMLTISFLLTGVTILSVLLAVLAVTQIAKRAQKRFVAMWAATGEVTAQVEESYTGHALVKVFGRHHEVEELFDQQNQRLYNATYGAQSLSGSIMPLMGFVGNIGYVAIAVIGGLRVVSGNITIGDVQAFIQYSRQFTQPVNQIASMMNQLQSGVASAERVFEVLDEAEQTPDGTANLPEPFAGKVSFADVAFSYDPDKPLITDLSLTAQPGQTIAIVGPTGAGKTTLVNLLMRFYDISDGAISLDDVDTASVPRAQLRAEVGMVLQDTWLFHGTIRENIAYGRPDASEDDIMAAAKATYVDRFVRSLPEGYDTMIDEEGSNVSAGEKQLLTIARAFLADPAILVLDEATSSVDTRTEVLVQRAMGALRQGRTSFVIAHRLSTIRDADTILVMEHGDIVEQGNHQTLLAAKGAYYTLYQSQFAGATDEA